MQVEGACQQVRHKIEISMTIQTAQHYYKMSDITVPVWDLYPEGHISSLERVCTEYLHREVVYVWGIK